MAVNSYVIGGAIAIGCGLIALGIVYRGGPSSSQPGDSISNDGENLETLGDSSNDNPGADRAELVPAVGRDGTDEKERLVASRQIVENAVKTSNILQKCSMKTISMEAVAALEKVKVRLTYNADGTELSRSLVAGMVSEESSEGMADAKKCLIAEFPKVKIVEGSKRIQVLVPVFIKD